MHRLATCVFLALPLWAGTQITDTVATPFTGLPFTGRVLIVGPSLTTADGRTVAAYSRTLQITGGNVSIELEPNDTAIPANTSYSVTWYPTVGSSWREVWSVYTSAVPLKVHQVRSTGSLPALAYPAAGDLMGNFPSPLVVRLRGRAISEAAPATGNALLWNGSEWAPGAVDAGSGCANCLFTNSPLPAANITGIIAPANGGTGANTASMSGIPKLASGVVGVAVANTDYAAASHALRHAAGGADAIGINWSQITTGVPSTFTPSAHATAHAAGGADALSLSATQIGGGQLASARGGLGVDSSAFEGVIQMHSGAASVAPGFSVDASGNIATDAAGGRTGNAAFAGVLTAASATIGSIASPTVIEVAPATTPAAPATGYATVWVDTVSKRLRSRDDAGIITAYQAAGAVATIAESASPGAAAAGTAFLYLDPASKTLRSNDDAGAVKQYLPSGNPVTITNSGVPGTPATGLTTAYVDAGTKHLRTVDDAGTVVEYSITGHGHAASEITSGVLSTARILPLCRDDSVGGTDAYTCTAPNIASISEGTEIILMPLANNAGPATLAINGGAAVPIRTADGAGFTYNDLLVAGRYYKLIWDGTTSWRLPQSTETANIPKVQTVGFSATPIFALALGTMPQITLTGDVTSSSMTGLSAGVQVSMKICQDGAGGHSFAWPASVRGAMSISTDPGSCSVQDFRSWDGTLLYASTPGVIGQ